MSESGGEVSSQPGKRKGKADDLGGEELQLAAEDPLLVFGSEIMTIILAKLDLRSVAEARLVSRGWQAVASSDRIWGPKDFFLIFRSSPKSLSASMSRGNLPSWKSGIASHGGLTANANWRKDVEKRWKIMYKTIPISSKEYPCQELWLDKAHIPRASKVEGLPKMIATLLSIRDGKRTRITRNDLCDHVWEFRFTESAPEYWRDLDPSWRDGGAPPMRRYFHPDGSITADPEDKVWGGHESSYTIVTGLLADGKVREHYVRINRWPKMSVERHPDWSWELRNHLYYYRSVPDAANRHDGTGPGFISLSGGFS